MNLATLIETQKLGYAASGNRIKAGIEAGDSLIVFDVTADALFYSLFEKYKGTDRRFVGLISKDFETLALADDIRLEGKAFFFEGGRS